MTEDSGQEGFLHRWSRRKREASESDDALEAGGEIAADAADAEDEGAEEPVALDELSDIDTLDKDSDYSIFMRAGVPEALRNRALRKLWLSDPVLANLDGLNDYDEDVAGILEEGAAFMRRLAEAGEKFTRPGSDPEDTSDEPVDKDAVPVAAATDGSGAATPTDDLAASERRRPDDSEQG